MIKFTTKSCGTTYSCTNLDMPKYKYHHDGLKKGKSVTPNVVKRQRSQRSQTPNVFDYLLSEVNMESEEEKVKETRLDIDNELSLKNELTKLCQQLETL